MSYEFYKILHLIGIAGLLLPLGAVIQHTFSGGTKQTLQNKKFLLIMHGVCLLIVFVAGFGLIARTGVGFPGWIWAKMGIWLVFGGAIAIALRSPTLARSLFLLLPAFVGLASYLVRFQPF